MQPLLDKARTGRLGEDAAARHLIGAGYQIVARNWRSGSYEIDLVARHRGTLHFVEVKTRRRGALTPPEAGLTPQKRRALRVAAEIYLADCAGHYTGYELSFDLASVEIDEKEQCSVSFVQGAIEYGWM